MLIEIMWCLSIFVLTKSLYSFVKIMYASCQGDGIVLHVHRQTLVFTTQIGKWSCYMHGFLAPAYKTLVFVFCVAFPTMNAKSTACVFHSIASCSQSQTSQQHRITQRRQNRPNMWNTWFFMLRRGDLKFPQKFFWKKLKQHKLY